jgi:aspartyl-tRNA synthetase
VEEDDVIAVMETVMAAVFEEAGFDAPIPPWPRVPYDEALARYGIDRCFQIARCFRDEDFRGDRQPEFTQLDLEMSFVDEDTVMAFVEAMVIEVCGQTTPDRPIAVTPFPRFTYDEAMDRFGSDKPDLRFGMELVDLGPLWAGAPSGFRVFDDALHDGGRVKAIVAPGMGGASRKEIDELTERAKRFGAKGLVWLALDETGSVRSSIAKFLGDDGVERLVARAGASPGDLVLVVADAADVTADVLGRLRAELGVRLGLADPDVLSFCWISRFPMYSALWFEMRSQLIVVL